MSDHLRTKDSLKDSFKNEIEEEVWNTPIQINKKKEKVQKKLQTPKINEHKEGLVIIPDIEKIRNLPITTGNNQHRVVISESIFQVFDSYCFDKKDKYSGSFINKLLFEIAKTDHFSKFNKHLNE